MPRRLLLLAVLFLSIAHLHAGEVNFGREVLPILSDACFHCHGPDEKARKAKLRLDTKEGAYRTKDGVTVVKPGSLEESELALRITSTDPDEEMPPPKANRKLKPEEVETLKRWIVEGGKWGQHWAFAAMEHPVPPPTDGAWGKNEIDAFVLKRLKQEKLEPSSEADKSRLLRRVSFDLTGLPPTPAELDSFLQDPAPDAYDKVVDRLLASPRYGERMATEWLDLARYADTHGYQADRTRSMSPWRDWVINSFNADMPFDQFATWQIAGDLLPGATRDQQLATAFNRLHSQNEEGGIVGEEYRVSYVVDRVNTFGTAFLGLTFECSRCHDHKYDPITQRDYYSLFSLFQNIDEAGQITFGGFEDKMPIPTLNLTSPEQTARLEELRVSMTAMEASLASLAEKPSDAANAFVATALEKGAWSQETPKPIAAYAFDAFAGGGVANSIDPTKPGTLHDKPVSTPGSRAPAALLDGDNGFDFPGVGVFERTDTFSFAIRLRPAALAERQVVFHHSKAPADAGSHGYELLLEEGRVAFGIHYLWPGSSLKIVTKAAIPMNEWTQIIATYDGSSRASGAHIYINGNPAEVEVVKDHLNKGITYSNGEPNLAIGYRFRDAGFRGGAVEEFQVYDCALTALDAAMLNVTPTPAEPVPPALPLAGDQRRADLLAYYFERIDPASAEIRSQLKPLRVEQNKIVSGATDIMVMQELPTPKPAYILKRGAYDAHGEEVTGATPLFLPPMAADAPKNRLGLARWLTDPEHPLLARVTVNRFWQMMFGRGLVETSDNFGTQGTPPSHPELLDWLARDFIASGWNVKASLRKMALSATYRQSSKTSSELLTHDPQNIFLARGPSRRLTAEMLRDQALDVSGLLAEKLGGVSVLPYQPPGLWEELISGKPHYPQGTGDDLHRRSLYTFWKRTIPPPAMMTFDSAERNTCVVRRQSTSTPMQALALLNDVQIMEGARAAGQRMLKEGGTTDEERLRWLFRLITSRAPRDQELAILAEIYKEQRETFATSPADAEKLTTFGEWESDQTLPAPELAAAAVTAEAVLNFDEAMMRR